MSGEMALVHELAELERKLQEKDERIEELERMLQTKSDARNFYKASVEELEAENALLNDVYEAVDDIKWRSIDKDNMEFATTCFAVDRIRKAIAAIQEKGDD